MRACSAVVITLLAAVLGYILSIYAATWAVLVAITIIVMGGCIIYTINKNFELLRKEIKSSSASNANNE